MGKLGVLGVWDIERRVRLEELAEKVAGDGGATPAQVGVLYVALAAEFQGFCRDLHEECIDEVTDLALPANRGQVIKLPQVPQQQVC